MELPRLAGARLAVLDFETTGVSRGDHRVVEIGLVFVEALRITDRFESLLNPGLPIHPGATAVHGLTDEDVADAPRFLELAADLHRRLAAVDAIVCHNAPFDMPFLQREMKAGGLPLVDRPVMDTLAAARAAWGRGGNSLGEVAARLGVKGGAAHRALADAEMTAGVLIEFAAHFGEEYPLAGFPGFVADGSIYYRGDAFRGVGGPAAPGAPASPDPAPSLADPARLHDSDPPGGAAPPNGPAALAAYAAPPARPNVAAEPPQNLTVMRILLNSAVRRRREVTVLLASPAPPPGAAAGRVAEAAPSPRPLSRRVEPRRVEEAGLVARCPVSGAEELFRFERILEVRW